MTLQCIAPQRSASAGVQERIRVLVCFDSPVLQAGLMAILSRHQDLDCRESPGQAPVPGGPAMPDVIVADHGRGIGWVNAAARAAAPESKPSVVIVTHSDRECDIRAALSGGAQGYLLIDEAPDHLAAAVRASRGGARILGPRVASRLAENVSLEALTSREESVLSLVVDGLCNKSIAGRLGISAGTVKSHLRSAFGKLGAASRTQAIAIAHRRGMLQVSTAASPREGQFTDPPHLVS